MKAAAKAIAEKTNSAIEESGHKAARGVDIVAKVTTGEGIQPKAARTLEKVHQVQNRPSYGFAPPDAARDAMSAEAGQNMGTLPGLSKVQGYLNKKSAEVKASEEPEVIELDEPKVSPAAAVVQRLERERAMEMRKEAIRKSVGQSAVGQEAIRKSLTAGN